MSADGCGHVVLVGMMGSGKTTLGRAVADRLGRVLLDSDEQVRARQGIAARAIADEDGVEALHDLERAVLLEALETSPAAVITAAASVVSDATCRSALARPTVVWLDAPVADLVDRVVGGDHRRPIDVVRSEALATERRSRFAEVANLRLDAREPTTRSADVVMQHLVGGRSSGPR